MIIWLSILIGMAIIFVVNICLNSVLYNLGIVYILLAVVLSTICVIAIDGIFAFIVRQLLPNKWFSADNFKWKVTKKECKFYEKFGIKKWKNKILDLGCFAGFRKDKINEPKNPEYLKRYIMEANYGFIVHLCCFLFGFLCIFIYPLKYCLMFGIPVAFVNAILNLMPAFSLRYNLPKLKRLYDLSVKKIKT